MSIPFFCVSYYEGDLSWVEDFCGDNYIVYSKGELNSWSPKNYESIPNVGYNIFSYFKYIVDHYEDLPEIVVFCKNNVFDRHVSEETFKRLCSRQVFTPFEEPGRWQRLAFPVSQVCGDGGYLELNNCWYLGKYLRLYFPDYYSFFDFIFEKSRHPVFLRFAPGANYLVPREHIKLRSKSFYKNLMKFVEHAPNSCESHFVERTLLAIWTSPLLESKAMSEDLDEEALSRLSLLCASKIRHQNLFIQRFKNWVFNRLCNFFYLLLGTKRG